MITTEMMTIMSNQIKKLIRIVLTNEGYVIYQRIPPSPTLLDCLLCAETTAMTALERAT